MPLAPLCLLNHFRLLCLALICTLLSCQTFGQTYKPATQKAEILDDLDQRTRQSSQAAMSALPATYRVDYLKIYKERYDGIKQKIDNKEVCADPAAKQYLDQLTQTIIDGNSILAQKVILPFFSRSGVPNASYFGEGLILMNMGLFMQLENESQAAFVIAHELAHLYLRHNENHIEEYVTTVNSPEVQAKLRDIRKNEYRKRSGLEELLKGLTFDTRRHGRYHESQADSLAVVLMKNAGFDNRESLTTLAILDTIDADSFDVPLALQNTFTSPNFPFKQKWLQKEEGLLGGHASLTRDAGLTDSLKTHPDCSERIEKLRLMIVQDSPAGDKVVNPKAFEELRKNFRYEIAEYAFAKKNYTRTLFYALPLLQQLPEDAYLVTLIGKSMNEIYNAQKEHSLSKVVDMPSPYFNPGYNLLLQFIQNLYLADIAGINYHFLNKYSGLAKTNKEYNEALSFSQKLNSQ